MKRSDNEDLRGIGCMATSFSAASARSPLFVPSSTSSQPKRNIVIRTSFFMIFIWCEYMWIWYMFHSYWYVIGGSSPSYPNKKTTRGPKQKQYQPWHRLARLASLKTVWCWKPKWEYALHNLATSLGFSCNNFGCNLQAELVKKGWRQTGWRADYFTWSRLLWLTKMACKKSSLFWDSVSNILQIIRLES